MQRRQDLHFQHSARLQHGFSDLDAEDAREPIEEGEY